MGEVEFMHRELAAGKWNDMTFSKQMANIGSEISRAIRWKSKGNAERMEACVERALELIDLTIVSCQLNIDKSKGRLREVLRCRDEICDYFYGYNEYEVDEILMQRYFDEFACVV